MTIISLFALFVIPLWRFYNKNEGTSVFIMAGGKGMRLRPLTSTKPKPMLLINDKPILLHIIEDFIQYGFRTFFISVNYLSDQITKYFGDGSQLGISIIYIYEDQPLGTAGSISLIPPPSPRRLLVINGDVLTKLNYDEP